MTEEVKEEVKAEEVVEAAPEVVTEPAPQIDVDHERAKAVELERKRVAEISDLGDKAGHKDLAQEYIKTGKSVSELNAEIVSRMTEDKPVVENQKELGLTQKEARSFSFVKAIRAMANPGDRRAQEDAAYERELSDAASKAYGKEARGFMVPNETLNVRAGRDQNTVDDADLVAEDHLGGSFIELLRNNLVVNQLGVRRLSGLRGDIDIPSQEGPTTAYWVGEGDAPAQSNATFGSRKATPHTVAAYVDMTRRIIIQSDPSIEALIRSDLAFVMAQAVDKAALEGDSVADVNSPLGVSKTIGINTIAGASMDWATMIDMQTALDSDNALHGSLSYVVNPVEAGVAKQTPKAAGEAVMLMAINPDSVAGYPAYVTNNLTAGNMIFGDWSDLIMCEWSGLDLMVDPYSLSTSGGVRTTAFWDVDFIVRHPESFCLATVTP